MVVLALGVTLASAALLALAAATLLLLLALPAAALLVLLLTLTVSVVLVLILVGHDWFLFISFAGADDAAPHGRNVKPRETVPEQVCGSGVVRRFEARKEDGHGDG